MIGLDFTFSFISVFLGFDPLLELDPFCYSQVYFMVLVLPFHLLLGSQVDSLLFLARFSLIP